MFGFLFRKHKPAATPAAPVASAAVPEAASSKTAPGTAIHYSPELIPKLKQDHQDLLARFGAVQTAFRAGRVAEVVERLEAFRTALQSHLLIENVRLYIYLEHLLAADEPSRRLVHEFRHEMDGLGRTLTAFLAKYRNLGADAGLLASFGAELETVGRVLADRIRREEETLYPLYAPVG